MMERIAIFDELKNMAGLWCPSDVDAGDLARVVEFVTEKNLNVISVAPDSVSTIWPWLEDGFVKIMARFYLTDKKVTEAQISDITIRINNAFKQGAHGAQIFMPYDALGDLVEQTHVIRDDLFFDKELSIGIDIGDVDVFEWEHLFERLRKINASSVLFVFTKDTGKKSDFVGRIYAMLNAWNDENKFDLNFALSHNFMRIEQAWRLVESMKPGLISRVKFFVSA
ncbi:MAG: hypothetical protein R8M37_02790 [Alphaproteobacteria bacterium]|nr:hypothetical protein [Alphaproteobacteria bacterium]